MIAYFDECLESTYYTIDRSAFETRLRTHYDGLCHDYDPGWYALRNIVFACGCRSAAFRAGTWTEAQAQAQGYFDNALSVEVDLLHGTPGLVATQALLIMVSSLDASMNSITKTTGSVRGRLGQPEAGIHAHRICCSLGPCQGPSSSTSLSFDPLQGGTETELDFLDYLLR